MQQQITEDHLSKSVIVEDTNENTQTIPQVATTSVVVDSNEIVLEKKG